MIYNHAFPCYERSTCKYVRLNALNIPNVHGPCFNFQVKNKALPLPRCELPWGVTQAFFETEARLVNQPDPIISMIGNQTKEFLLRTPKGPLLTLCHIYDADGNELVIDDDRGVKYTVLLNRKNTLPTMDEDEVN